MLKRAVSRFKGVFSGLEKGISKCPIIGRFGGLPGHQSAGAGGSMSAGQAVAGALEHVQAGTDYLVCRNPYSCCKYFT